MTEETVQLTTKKPRDPRALNAYRHGLTGQVLILTPEDQGAYQKHCDSIRESLLPVGGIECQLVQSIADDHWRLNLAVALQTNIFATGLTEPDALTAHHPQIDTAFAQARVWLADGDKIARLSLYESRIQRKVEKNMEMLRQLQADRKAALNQVVEEAAILMQLAESKGEPFDFDRDFPVGILYPQFVFSNFEIARLVARNRLLLQAKNQFSAPSRPLRKAA